MATDLDTLFDLGGVRTSGGPRKLSGATFTGEVFPRFWIGPGVPPDACVSIVDSTFSKCVFEGNFRVAPGTIIENVLFDQPRITGMMVFNTESVLSGLVLKGGHECGGLWVKPSASFSPAEKQATAVAKEWAQSKWDSIPLMIDFSELDPVELEVVGLPLEKLRWNRTRQVAISLSRFRRDVLDSMALPPGNYWWHRLRALQLFRTSEGVFALPHENQKNYSEVMHQRDELLQAGVIS